MLAECEKEAAFRAKEQAELGELWQRSPEDWARLQMLAAYHQGARDHVTHFMSIEAEEAEA